MLKQILASLALTVGIIHTSIASESVVINTKTSCVSYPTLTEVLEKYGEIPFVSMTAYRSARGDTVVHLPAIMFVNPTTKSYTLVEKFNDELYCVISIGEKLNPGAEK